MILVQIKRVDLDPQEKPLKTQKIKSISKIIDSKEFILGENVKGLEKKIAKYIGAKDCVGVASGTDALTLSLRVLDIGPGDEVITTPFTMAANVEAIMHVGATPVFADVSPKTFNILAWEIENKITEHTRAIIPVHLFGQACEMDRIIEIASRHNLHVIEDVCQAFGASFRGKKCGSFGVLGALSFFPTKNLCGYGDGGMIIVNDPRYSEKLRILRAHGQEKKYVYKYLGYNSRLDEIQAAIILPKLKRIDKWNFERKKIAQKYNKLLSKIPKMSVPNIPTDSTHVFHLYTIKCDRRNELAKFLSDSGIQTAVNFPAPLHLQEGYNSGKWKKGDFPNAEHLCENSISLPMFVGMNDKQIKHVCKRITDFYNSA